MPPPNRRRPPEGIQSFAVAIGRQVIPGQVRRCQGKDRPAAHDDPALAPAPPDDGVCKCEHGYSQQGRSGDCVCKGSFDTRVQVAREGTAREQLGESQIDELRNDEPAPTEGHQTKKRQTSGPYGRLPAWAIPHSTSRAEAAPCVPDRFGPWASPVVARNTAPRAWLYGPLPALRTGYVSTSGAAGAV